MSANLEAVLMFDVHEVFGGVDVFAAIKGPTLPAFVLSQLANDLLADRHRQGPRGGAPSPALLTRLRP